MASGLRRGRSQPLSQINVTPLVDVMLVLLIIFMVTAPMLEQGLDVQLPHVEKAAALPDEQQVLIISISPEAVAVGQQQVSAGKSLAPVVRQIMQQKSHRQVLIKADKQVAYGRVMQIMAQLKTAGISRVGLVTRPVATTKE